jgi:hypothetical protein
MDPHILDEHVAFTLNGQEVQYDCLTPTMAATRSFEMSETTHHVTASLQ